MNIFVLLILFQVKHFVADGPLQTSYMLGKFKDGHEWIVPLFAHALVHATGTFLIASLAGCWCAPYLAILDLMFHFTIDRIKASPKLLGRFKPMSKEQMENAQRVFAQAARWTLSPNSPMEQETKRVTKQIRSNTLFWHSLLLDQMGHHLTHYGIIWLILYLK